MNTSSVIDLGNLESHLWEAANILRGPVDAADFKTYIFPLLFFKRISDVYDEEFQAALEESGGDRDYAAFAENHCFLIPEGCHWRDVQAHTVNVGQALSRALREIEKVNPRALYGIFGDAQWTNKERLSDALLCDLIDHFSRLPLPNRAVDADILGQAYEYLIKKFADATNKNLSENCHVAQDAGTSELDEGQPIGGFLAPTGPDTASLRQPAQGAFDHPAPCWELGFAGRRTRLWRWLAAFALAFDVRNITGLLDDVAHIVKVVALITAEMLF